MTKQESDTGRFVWVMIGCLFVCLFVCLSDQTLYLVFLLDACAVSAVVCCMCGVVKGK